MASVEWRERRDKARQLRIWGKRPKTIIDNGPPSSSSILDLKQRAQIRFCSASDMHRKNGGISPKFSAVAI
jgi:hypothetical protein